MQVTRFIICSLLYLFCANIFAQSMETCSGVIETVGHYLNDKPQDKALIKQAENWQEVSWIQKQLGQGTKSQVINQTYFWQGFGLITVNDNAISTIGKVPEKLAKASLTPVPSLETALNVLGKPIKINSKNFYRYTWICSDTNSNLIVNATQAGKVLTVAGMSCLNKIADSTSSSECVGFSSLKAGQKTNYY